MKTTKTASEYEIETLRSQIRECEDQVMHAATDEDRADRQRLLDKLCKQLAATGG